MKPVKSPVVWFALLYALGSAGCDLSRDQLSKAGPNACTRSIDGIDYFLGSPECFKALPRREIAGYWVVGLEYSVFYEDKRSIKRVADDDAPTLLLSPLANSVANKYVGDGGLQVFELRAVASISPDRGIYGAGTSPSGIYVWEISELREVLLAE